MKAKLTREPISGGLWIAAIVIFVAAIGAFLLIKTPSVAEAENAANNNRAQIQKSAEEANKQIAAMQASLSKRDWGLDPAKVIPQAMAQISKVAGTYGVGLASFRPGRNQNLSYITIIPITISVTGSYPQLVKFIKDVEDLQKVNLSSVQISESGQSQDQVMATVTAVVYTTNPGSGDNSGTS